MADPNVWMEYVMQRYILFLKLFMQITSDIEQVIWKESL